MVLQPVDGNKNFTGSNITVDFNIIKEYVNADLNVFNSNGVNVTVANSVSNVKGYKVTDEKAINYSGDSFDFDGTAKTFASEVLKNISKTHGNHKPDDQAHRISHSHIIGLIFCHFLTQLLSRKYKHFLFFKNN